MYSSYDLFKGYKLSLTAHRWRTRYNMEASTLRTTMVTITTTQPAVTKGLPWILRDELVVADAALRSRPESNVPYVDCRTLGETA